MEFKLQNSPNIRTHLKIDLTISLSENREQLCLKETKTLQKGPISSAFQNIADSLVLNTALDLLGT